MEFQSWDGLSKLFQVKARGLGIVTQAEPWEGYNLGQYSFLLLAKGNAQGGTQLCSLSTDGPSNWEIVAKVLKKSPVGPEEPISITVHALLCLSHLVLIPGGNLEYIGGKLKMFLRLQ